jgi:hypothetical protein
MGMKAPNPPPPGQIREQGRFQGGRNDGWNVNPPPTNVKPPPPPPPPPRKK